MTVDTRAERAYQDMPAGEQRNVRHTLAKLARGELNLKWTKMKDSKAVRELGVPDAWSLRSSRTHRMFFDALPGNNAQVTLLMLAFRGDRRFYNDERGGGF